jgi:hypothetical protein
MKKFLGILAIAGALVACNNSGEATTSNDTTATDTAAMTSIPPADTTGSAMDTTKMSADTVKK